MLFRSLDFILGLRPVTYYLDIDKLESFLGTADHARIKDAEAEKSKILQTGFVAQEVEEVAIKLGYNFSGIDKPKGPKDYYSLRYAEFTVPLVKAVQELNKLNEQQQATIEVLKQENDQLKERLARIEKLIEQLAK